MANECHGICPSVSPDSLNQLMYDFSVSDFSNLGKDDTFYVFTTVPDKEQGIVHERTYVDGIPRLHEIVIGDQFASVLSNTDTNTLVATSGNYLLSYDKIAGIVDLYQMDDAYNSSLALALQSTSSSAVSTVDIPLASSSVSSPTLLSDIISCVNDNFKKIVTAGVFIGLSWVSPYLGVGYFVSIYLAGSVDANPAVAAYGLLEAAIFVTAVGAIALALSNGQNYGSIDLKAIEDFFDDKGVAHFVILKDGHYYKYKYDKNVQNPKAEYLGEVEVIEGVITMAIGEVLICNGEVVRTVKDVTENVLTYIQVGLNDLRERFHLAPLYYRLNGKYHHDYELNFAKGVELMKRCDNKDENGRAIWIGSTKEGCEKLAKKATEEMGEDSKKLKPEKTGTQPWHYHANSPKYKHCGAHCFWDYVDFFKPKEPQIKPKTDL